MTPRLFAAVDAGPEIAAALGQAIARVRSHASGASWSRGAAAHITLVFLGDVPDDRAPVLLDAIREAAGRGRPLVLGVRGAGVFGRESQPRVLWAGIEGDTGPLAALKAELERALVPLGFVPEDRDYHPHLTLARARGQRGDSGLARCAAELRDHAFGVVRVDAVTLFRSELHPSGARHHVVGRCALGAAP